MTHNWLCDEIRRCERELGALLGSDTGNAADRVLENEDLMRLILTDVEAKNVRKMALWKKSAKDVLVERRNMWMKSQARRLADRMETFWDRVVEVFRRMFWGKPYTFSSRLDVNEDGLSVLYLLMGDKRIASMTACLLDGVYPGFDIKLYFETDEDLEDYWKLQGTDLELPIIKRVYADAFSIHRSRVTPNFDRELIFEWPTEAIFVFKAYDTPVHEDVCIIQGESAFSGNEITSFMLGEIAHGYDSRLRANTTKTKAQRGEPQDYPAGYSLQPTRRQTLGAKQFKVQLLHN